MNSSMTLKLTSSEAPVLFPGQTPLTRPAMTSTRPIFKSPSPQQAQDCSPPNAGNPYDFADDCSLPSPPGSTQMYRNSAGSLSGEEDSMMTTLDQHERRGADDGKSSSKRRKQSNPVRISAEGEAPEDAGGGQDLTSEANVAVQTPSSGLERRRDITEGPLDLTATPKREEEGTEEGEIPKSLHPQHQALMSQLQSSQAASGTLANAAAMNPFLLANQMKQEQGMIPFGSHPFLFPFFPRSAGAPGEQGPGGQSPGLLTIPTSLPPGASPIRIFNPEAYCDLCNKEFCNKYFLKTHKANKHGIYQPDEAPIPATTPVSSSSASSTTSSTTTTTSATILPPTTAPMEAQGGVNNSASTAGSNPVPSHPSAAPARFPMVSYGVPSSASLAFVASMSAASTTPSALISSHPMPQLITSITRDGKLSYSDVKCSIPGVINIEAYCHVCQKEFCNKYFLKRHKLKIHGIVTPEPENGKERKARAKPTRKSGSGGSATGGGTGGGGEPPVKKKAAFETTCTCPVCKQDFPTALELDNHIIQVHKVNRPSPNQPVQPPPEATQLPPPEHDNRKREDLSDEVKSDTSSPRPISIFQMQLPGAILTHEKLRQMGVINPEAFCELCCKEFCNKYFLRTHKHKKHGVPYPEGYEPKKKEKAVKSEQTRIGSDDGKSQEATATAKTLPSTAEARQDRTTNLRTASPTSQIDCGRPFTTLHLLEMHRRFFHAREQETSTQEAMENGHGGDKGDGRGADGSLTSGGTASSEDIRKLQGMIKGLHSRASATQQLSHSDCRFCEKKFDSIYSLQVHLMKDHGILQQMKQEGIVEGDRQAVCPICKKDFLVKACLNQHLQTAHGVPSAFVSPLKMQAINGDDMSLRDAARLESSIAQGIPLIPKIEPRKSTWSSSRSYCEICNKELCNKYFMRTHMQKMHGINIENGSNIAGVTCDICKKELSSKYFLRVHKQHTHGIIEENKEGSPGSSDSESTEAPGFSSHEGCTICGTSFISTDLLKAHLIGEHGEEGRSKWQEIEDALEASGIRCKQCSRPFMDQVALHVHMIKHHGNTLLEPPSEGNRGDDEGQGQPGNKDGLNLPSYKCSLCPYTSNNLPGYIAHERSHLIPPVSKLQCPMCFMEVPSFEVLQQHLLSHQLSSFLNPFLSQGMGGGGGGGGNLAQQLAQPYPLQLVSQPVPKTPGQFSRKKRKGKSKRFKCPSCPKKFRSRKLCLSHIHSEHNPRRGRHRIFVVLRPPRPLFRCEECGTRKSLMTRRKSRKKIRTVDESQAAATMMYTMTGRDNKDHEFLQPFFLTTDSPNLMEDGETGRPPFMPPLLHLPPQKTVSTTESSSTVCPPSTLTPA
ncbi:unnamed protein product [Cyprideis torosa]|uniref:Uncharacterized protein n=1 Tax=Cyprideis torosa TaxID=163714 RepID=A0A7R8W0I9_9CRUS|nr:unnamed protein product [Cyprideis torosa]CAG0879803.1 unnamed protein product [Cyprideis torosa]